MVNLICAKVSAYFNIGLSLKKQLKNNQNETFSQMRITVGNYPNRIQLWAVAFIVLSFLELSYGSDQTAPGFPSDLNIYYEWHEGSMPPPDHFSYAIQITAAGKGTIIFRPDYPGDKTPEWTEIFFVQEKEIRALLILLKRHGLFNRHWREKEDYEVGDSWKILRVKANGKKYGIPARPDVRDTKGIQDIYKFIQNLVPDKIWGKLTHKREEYIDKFYNSPLTK